MKAIVVIDGISDQAFTDNISIKYELISYPDGHIKSCGITGKQLLKPMPEKKASIDDGGFIENFYAEGWNDCIDEILGEEE